MFSYPEYRKVARQVKGVGTGLYDLLGHKRDHRILLDVEEVFALQLAVLHAACGIHAVGLNLDVQNASRDIRRRECQGGVPLIESTVESHRRLHEERNLALPRRNRE